MVKHKGRRAPILKGNVGEVQALGTLASNTLIGSLFDEVVNERSFLLSLNAIWSIEDLVAGDGPVLVGVAHGDYTDAEVEEVIENANSWNRGDLVQQEVARRKVRQVGTFMGGGESVLNEGRMIKTPLKFIVNQGQTLRLWAYNASSATLNTGAIVTLAGHVWIKTA